MWIRIYGTINTYCEGQMIGVDENNLFLLGFEINNLCAKNNIDI